MSEINENTLDRHFVSQLRIMCDVYSNHISKSDFVMSQRWLQVFHKSSRAEKYARNCLMLLMYGQLREMGKLGMPFIKVENMDRSLEDVLSDYQGMTTNVSCYNESLRLHERLGGGSQCIDYANTNFQLLTQQNQQLIQEINQMHARTVENEQLYRQADTHWQQRILEGQGHLPLPLLKPRMQWLLQRIDRGAQLAIRQLQGWATSSGPLNFLYLSLQHILDDDPEARKLLAELDRKLEAVLDNMLEQAGERRENNVRMLYDKLFQQQQEALITKQQLLHHEQRALVLARQQLQVHVQDLKQREEIFWDQAAASPYYSTQSRAISYNKAETMRSTKTQTNSDTFDADSYSGSDFCGCDDCQPGPELGQLSNPADLMDTCDKHSCQYCQSQRPKDSESSSKC
ncbi:uncharacterized protein Dmoj_GI16631 [Drosophila mojavensis]|uniref:DUF4485 domain-containing protein n=1 Tax=Drosophila mojavensis TaxID=7230 RepID=B4L934_DROMO|nr:uncharacterized protein Dmoj_GI16631 [Drosophila mojavensis]